MTLAPSTGNPIPSTAPTDPARHLAPSEAPPLPAATAPQPAGKLSLRQRWARFPCTWQLWLSMTALMGLAAFFRFWRIAYQCYWTDESYTVNRIKGSFSQMLAMLSDQGFPPGWYALLRWWTMLVEHFSGSAYTALTPASTRSLTAIVGVLTVPAMYFLARQFTDRKGSLLVALLTAVNPFLIYYSRDIKMYPAMWLFVILNTAIFFQWMTTHKHLLWFPLYVLTGFLMTAMHAGAWFVVALQLIFLLTGPAWKHIKALDAPLWLTGVFAMSLLPIYWYLNRTNWVDRMIERGGDAGFSFVPRYTDMSWQTIASLPCAHLLGYLWPSFPPDEHVRMWFELGPDFDRHVATRAWPWMAHWQLYVALAVAAIMILGLVPWRGFRRSAERRASATRYRFWWLALWIALPTVCLALTWIPPDSPWHDRVWHFFPKVSRIWEPRYLGIIVPAWILWLAASLRRLPTWPVRTLAILFVLAASGFSALSNHLILRNPPFHKAAEIAVKYYDPDHRNSLVVAHSGLTTPGMVIPLSYDLAEKIPPLMSRQFLPSANVDIYLRGTAQTLDFLRAARLRPQVQTLVLTDRDGDLTDPKEPLSDGSMAEFLGPRWHLAEEQNYDLHYEWRFYIFNTWRTRVWVRANPADAPPRPTGAATVSEP